MARETKDVEVGKIRYRITQHPARRGIKLGTTMTRLAGPSVAKLFGDGAVKMESLVAGKANDAIGGALTALLERIDEDGVVELFLEMVSETVRFAKDTGGEVQQYDLSDVEVFDDVFSANYGELFSLLKEVVKVNLASFFVDGRIGKVWANALKTADLLISGGASKPQ